MRVNLCWVNDKVRHWLVFGSRTRCGIKTDLRFYEARWKAAYSNSNSERITCKKCLAAYRKWREINNV